MTYKSYQHIEKFGSGEVEGITKGTCYISYKIDGTNGCIWLKEDETLGFGSRRRELNNVSKENDNQQFVELMLSESYIPDCSKIKEYLLRHPKYIVYGEWLVPSTLKTYKDDAWKKFYIFDIFDTETGKYIPYEEYSKELPNCIPLICKLDNPTEDDLKACLDKTGEWLVKSGLGEGIVIKNYEFVNRYGRRTWAKMLTEDYRAIKKDGHKTNHENKINNQIEYEIIKLMTDQHILKEKNKVMELHSSNTFEAKFIPEMLNRTYDEFIRDNIQIIILKKFRGKTINFTVLKKLSDEKIKKLLVL